MSTSITVKEFAVLRAIDTSEYGDGILDPIWTFSVWDNVDYTIVPDRKSLSGIMASLNKKGLIASDDDGDESCAAFTRKGLAVYLSLMNPEKVNKWICWSHDEPEKLTYGRPVNAPEYLQSIEGRHLLLEFGLEPSSPGVSPHEEKTRDEVVLPVEGDEGLFTSRYENLLVFVAARNAAHVMLVPALDLSEASPNELYDILRFLRVPADKEVDRLTWYNDVAVADARRFVEEYEKYMDNK